MILWGYRLQSNSSEGNPNKFSHQCTSAKITWFHGCDESHGPMWLSWWFQWTLWAHRTGSCGLILTQWSCSTPNRSYYVKLSDVKWLHPMGDWTEWDDWVQYDNRAQYDNLAWWNNYLLDQMCYRTQCDIRVQYNNWARCDNWAQCGNREKSYNNWVQ